MYGRARRGAASAGIMVVVLGVAGQLVVPGIATDALRSRLARHGRVLSVRVSAFPWVQLLWRHADSVSARLADYNLTPGELQQLLHEGASTDTVHVTVTSLRIGPVALHDVRLDKRGAELEGAASLYLETLRSALPFVQSLKPVHDANGQFVLRGTAGAFGLSASADVTVAAREGALVVAPSGILADIATITVYDDPRLRVLSVSAGEVPGGVRLTTRGRLQ